MRSLAVIAALAAGPVLAQDLPPFDIAWTEQCLEHRPLDPGCIGAAAERCMGGDRGQTTVGMGFCLDRELQWWDARLNAVYSETSDRMKRDDRERWEGAPEMAPALLAMQRAWIAYRDARCDFERALWAGGTGGGPATLGCLMQETGRQSLIIEEATGD